MRKTYKFILSAFLFLGTGISTLSAAQMDPLLEKIDLSGFLRMRAWYTGSTVKVPDKFPETGGYNDVNYQDLFFRNRLYISLLPTLEIRSVFDISAQFGKDDFSMGNGGTNLVTRDVYAVFRPGRNSELSLGLMPFSTPGGHILARDATGIHYTHNFPGQNLKTGFSFIRAFDNADSGYSDESDIPEYADNNIFMVEAEIAPASGLMAKLYYVYEYDRYTTDGEEDDDNPGMIFVDDGRKAFLSWLGLHMKYTSGDFFVRGGGIINFGYLKTRYTYVTDPFEKTDVLAGLWEFEAGMRSGKLQVSLVAEGASGDASDSSDKNSFQDIKASHGFSLIAVDNSGGLSVRGSGESSWYGLYGQGLKAEYSLFNAVLLKMSLLHFRTLKSLDSSNWFGDECDLEAEYSLGEEVSIFGSGAVFLPNEAYKEIVQQDKNGYVLEFMAGVTISY